MICAVRYPGVQLKYVCSLLSYVGLQLLFVHFRCLLLVGFCYGLCVLSIICICGDLCLVCFVCACTCLPSREAGVRSTTLASSLAVR